MAEGDEVFSAATTTDHPPAVDTFDITIPIIPTAIGLLMVVIVIALIIRFQRRHMVDGNG